mgnify:CR=1 FL=1
MEKLIRLLPEVISRTTLIINHLIKNNRYEIDKDKFNSFISTGNFTYPGREYHVENAGSLSALIGNKKIR